MTALSMAQAAKPQTVVALAERAVPRYTSYPTAPHFHAGIDAACYEHWLGELNADMSLSLYLHVPFCREMCWYCGCHTKIVNRREPLDAYEQRLLAEIDLIAARTPARKIRHLHWGGGTPTSLGVASMTRIVARIAERFDMSAVTEHAVELDPRQLTQSDTEALASMGVTRASLGVQDLNEHVQRAIGRVQPCEQVRQAVAWLREAGITGINFDLMYGLPQQTDADVRRTVELAAAMAPDRVAVFGYAHVPWFKSHQKLIDTEALPGAEARLVQANVARDALVARGYEAIGLDHFALPDDELSVAARWGTIRRNFQGYTTDESDALLGLGASAIGRLPQGFVQNAPDFGHYNRAIDAGRLATARGYALTAMDRLRADLIERVMCDGEVDVDAIASTHGVDPSELDGDLDGAQSLVEDGFVTIDGRRLMVTNAGQPLLRLVACIFDEHAKPANRHAPAV